MQATERVVAGLDRKMPRGEKLVCVEEPIRAFSVSGGNAEADSSQLAPETWRSDKGRLQQRVYGPPGLPGPKDDCRQKSSQNLVTFVTL